MCAQLLGTLCWLEAPTLPLAHSQPFWAAQPLHSENPVALAFVGADQWPLPAHAQLALPAGCWQASG